MAKRKRTQEIFDYKVHGAAFSVDTPKHLVSSRKYFTVNPIQGGKSPLRKAKT